MEKRCIKRWWRINLPNEVLGNPGLRSSTEKDKIRQMTCSDLIFLYVQFYHFSTVEGKLFIRKQLKILWKK